MKKLKTRILFLFISICLFAGCAAEQKYGQAVLPASAYTTADAITETGCPNLYKVSDVLYRGAQPEGECFPALQQLGIRTVIDLRMFHSDEKAMKGTSLKYVTIPMAPWDPKIEQVREFLGIVTNPENQPVFLHCKHGSDRTGTLVAAYRIIIQGWSKERAIQEMTEGPFGFHEFWSGLPRFINKLDAEALRREFHISANTQSSVDNRLFSEMNFR